MGMDRLSSHWVLDPQLDFLNHGSFGAAPRAVLDFQRALQLRLERQPVQFMARDLEPMLNAVSAELAQFVGADADEIVPVSNATTAVNTVLWSLPIEPGDELLTTDHCYNACKNALDRVAQARGARVVVVDLPFPVEDERQILATILAAVSEQTTFALIDHITSPTALVFPVEQLVRALHERGVEVMIDGAHALGMLPLDLHQIGAAFYTANAHKWLCAPKGAAFLYVERGMQPQIRPLVTSHGASLPLTDASQRFRAEFNYTGTLDPTPYLCIPKAIEVLAALVEGGWPEVRRANRALALAARRVLCERFELAPPCPESMLGAIATLILPDAPEDSRTSILQPDPLQLRLLQEHRIEVPIFSWPAPPRRLLRVSAQLYNSLEQYERLADALGILRALQ
jgi:isopenicillin-N epimerase